MILNIHPADQQQLTPLIEMYQDRQLEKRQLNQAIAKQEAAFWASTINLAYSNAVWSFNTARYEDVKKDVERGKLTPDDVHLILSRMVGLGAIEETHARIWYNRIAGQSIGCEPLFA
jgi:hypothetical protein